MQGWRGKILRVDLTAITKANYLCNALGLDTMTMEATLACAMKLYEKGTFLKMRSDDRLFGGMQPH